MKLNFEFEEGFLDKKHILVTGASKGIGREIALGLSKFGANVILHGRREDALDEIYDEIISQYKTDPIIIKCDLNLLDEDKSKEIAEVISKNTPCLDGIINNAAILGKMSSIADFDLDTWQKVLNTNLTSSFLLVKYLTPLMENSERPRIIFTSSGVAQKERHSGELMQSLKLRLNLYQKYCRRNWSLFQKLKYLILIQGLQGHL